MELMKQEHEDPETKMKINTDTILQSITSLSEKVKPLQEEDEENNKSISTLEAREWRLAWSQS